MSVYNQMNIRGIEVGKELSIPNTTSTTLVVDHE